jgi:hypothetical protein
MAFKGETKTIGRYGDYTTIGLCTVFDMDDTDVFFKSEYGVTMRMPIVEWDERPVNEYSVMTDKTPEEIVNAAVEWIKRRYEPKPWARGLPDKAKRTIYGSQPTFTLNEEAVLNKKMVEEVEAELSQHVRNDTTEGSLPSPFISRLFDGSFPVSDEGWTDLGATRSGTFIVQNKSKLYVDQILNHFGVEREPSYEEVIKEALEISAEATEEVNKKKMPVFEDALGEEKVAPFSAHPMSHNGEEGFFLNVGSYKWALSWVNTGIDAVTERESTTKVEIEKKDLNLLLDWAIAGASAHGSEKGMNRIQEIEKLLPGENRTA